MDIIEELRKHMHIKRVAKDPFGKLVIHKEPCPLAQRAAREIRLLRLELMCIKATRAGRKKPYSTTSLVLARLDTLVHYHQAHGLMPGIDRMRDLWSLRTYSSVDKTLRTLEAHGYITRQRYARRGVTILKTSDGKSYGDRLKAFGPAHVAPAYEDHS
jgi:DNA-binding MarR family transcriptional regulator